MEYTKEYKRKIYDSLPDDLKNAIISVESFEKLQTIGNKYSLMLDKQGELGDEVGLFMLGLTKQNDFVKNVSRRLGIPYDKAQAISKDINTEIFDAIRESLQKIQSQNPEENTIPVQSPSTPPTPPPPQSFHPNPAIAHVEKVGNFTVERVKPVVPSQYNDSNLQKEKVLKEIENPRGEVNGFEFVDHLLTKPEGSFTETTEIKKPTEPPAKPKTPIEVPPRKSGIDPYREPVE